MAPEDSFHQNLRLTASSWPKPWRFSAASTRTWGASARNLPAAVVAARTGIRLAGAFILEKQVTLYSALAAFRNWNRRWEPSSRERLSPER